MYVIIVYVHKIISKKFIINKYNYNKYKSHCLCSVEAFSDIFRTLGPLRASTHFIATLWSMAAGLGGRLLFEYLAHVFPEIKKTSYVNM